MRLKTISYILASLSIGIMSGLVMGSLFLMMSGAEGGGTLAVIGAFLGFLSIGLFSLALEIEDHTINLEEVKQW